MTTQTPDLKKLREVVSEMYESSRPSDSTVGRWASVIEEATDAYEASARDAEILRKGIESVSVLIDSSQGVYGLHLNDDPSPWSELREGGHFEAWLLAFDEAIAARHATQGD